MKAILLTLFIFFLFYILNNYNRVNNIPVPDFPVNSFPRKNYEEVKEVEEEEKPVRLFDVLKRLSSADKVVLNNVSEKWSINRNVMDPTLNERITKLIQVVVEGVGFFSKNDYYIKTIENMYIMKDDIENFRAILSCFIYDVKNFHTIKLIIDFIFFDNILYINSIDVDESGIKNVIQRYDFKHNSQGILMNHDVFDENIQILLDTHYKTKFRVIPLDHKEPVTDLSGVVTMKYLTKEILPKYDISKESPHFCNKYSTQWDTKSLLSQNEDCMFDNPTIRHYPNEPRHIPGYIEKR